MIIVFIIIIILCVIWACRNARYGTGRNVKVQFKSEQSGRVVHSGNGHSIGDAMVDGFSKMYYSLTENSRIDTIESKYNGMRNALSENRNRMRPDAISQCERYISLTSDLLYRRKNAKQIAEQRKKEEKRKEEERRRAEEREYEKQERERKKLLEEKRRAEAKEHEEQQRIHKQFIDQQRKLMGAKLRYAVLQRDGFRCQLCGATKGNGVVLHVDHIIPVSKGGLTEMSNLRTLCERCNLGKGDSIEEVHHIDSPVNSESGNPNEAEKEEKNNQCRKDLA